MAEDIRKHLPDLYGACGKRASFFMPMKLRTYVQTFNMSQQAFTFSGEAAKSYDQYLGPFLFEPSALMLSALVPPHYKGQVLELAAGTGRLTQHLVRRLANPAQLTVTDLNPDMLAIAEKKADHTGMRYQVEDMQQLSFADESFDLVICQYGVMFPPDKAKVFREMHRVLKPGGQMIFSTWDSTREIPFLTLLFDEILLPFFQTPDKTKYVVPFHMHHPEQLHELMEQAGFQQRSLEKIDLTGTAASPAELVQGFIYKHQMGHEIREQDPDAVERIAHLLEEEIGQRFGKGPVTCQLRCLVGIALR